jgi:hypothetical protein
MSVILQSSGGGQITIQEPATASNFTQTLPAATGEVMVSGNMPAFSATLSGNQSITSTVTTKVAFNTEEFDTNNNFDSTTNYRFTPTVAGYYQVNAVLYLIATGGSFFGTYIYKNGSMFKQVDNRPSATVLTNTFSSVIYMNGSTDYLEVYQRIDGVSPIVVGASTGSVFSASLVRTA